jgi:hypothetical protein
LAITSPTSGGRSVGIIRSNTQTTEFQQLFIVAGKIASYSSTYKSYLRYSSGLDLHISLPQGSNRRPSVCTVLVFSPFDTSYV